MSDKLDNEALTMRLVSIVEQAREHVSRSVNTAMVQAYWLMGREIVESDQAGRTRADYGEALMRAVAKNLQSQFGRGFSYSNVKRMRQFYVTYPQGSPAIADSERRDTVAPFHQGINAVSKCNELEPLLSADAHRCEARA